MKRWLIRCAARVLRPVIAELSPQQSSVGERELARALVAAMSTDAAQEALRKVRAASSNAR